tara:strand:- start:2164 stop:2997 length:834 start_codon:yes stop_codon:yes gene_type:complete
MKFERIIRELHGPQALLPSLHSTLAHTFASDVSQLREPGIGICGEEIERKGLEINDDGHAFLPVAGVLARNLSPMMRNGATDYNEIRTEIREAIDAGARTLTLEIDSGGGSISGLPETAAAIRAATIPTTAFVVGGAYSAAYWLASQCDRVVGTLSSGFGSIGVYIPPFWDYSQMLENEGVKIRFAYSGEHKAAGGFPEISMTDAQFAEIQRSVEATHEQFKEEVARARPYIDAQHMEAQTYEGLEALRFGFVDLILNTPEDYNPQIRKNYGRHYFP